jgi:hypothetical protein
VAWDIPVSLTLQADDFQHFALATGAKTLRYRSGCNLFNNRVPLSAPLALPTPFGCDATAGLAYIGALGLGHEMMEPLYENGRRNGLVLSFNLIRHIEEQIKNKFLIINPAGIRRYSRTIINKHNFPKG